MIDDEAMMQRALVLAKQAQTVGEVPVGAVLVKEGCIIAEGWNRPISTTDPTAHAEIIALRAAARSLGNYRLTETTLYVTLEPCVMCLGAILHARVKRLVYAASDPKVGAVARCAQFSKMQGLNHTLTCEGGVLAEAAGNLLRNFFRAKR